MVIIYENVSIIVKNIIITKNKNLSIVFGINGNIFLIINDSS